MSTKLLTQDQAQAVYNAMCELNNVCGRIRADVDGNTVSVTEGLDGSVVVRRYRAPSGFPFLTKEQLEVYADQSAFSAAYGLE